MAKLKLDLHDIFNKGKKIDVELERVIQEAVQKRIPIIEIIPGKGSGQLKKRVLRFLQQPHIKKLYHRIDKDSDNFGRLFIRFKHERPM
ncbi:MAG: Smr/MutS family protein [Candidatus Omnitrophota bacterium]